MNIIARCWCSVYKNPHIAAMLFLLKPAIHMLQPVDF